MLTGLWCADGRGPTTGPQLAREVKCALALAERLKLVVDAPKGQPGEAARKAFTRNAKSEAAALARAPFAAGLIRVMASVYESEADRFLGSLSLFDIRREAAQARSYGRLLHQQAKAAKAGVQAFLVLQALVAEEGTAGYTPDQPDTGPGSSTDEGRPRATTLSLEQPAVQAQLPLLAQALWCLTALDMEGTLRRVCRRVLCDTACSIEDRARRARALRWLGHTFRKAADRAVGVEPSDDPNLLCETVRDAASRLADGGHGAQGQDDF